MASKPPTFDTLDQLVNHLGKIPLPRIRLWPHPGKATEKDAIYAVARYGCACELVDRILVEKYAGLYESRLGGVLFYTLERFLEKHDLGVAYPAGTMIQPIRGMVRLPDVSFCSWAHFPDRLLPADQLLHLAPDLVVEIFRPSNTKKEMARKRKDYFRGGSKLVWEVDAIERIVAVYTAPDESKLIREKGTLDGGTVLPGFKLSVAKLFARAGKRAG